MKAYLIVFLGSGIGGMAPHAVRGVASQLAPSFLAD